MSRFLNRYRAALAILGAVLLWMLWPSPDKPESTQAPEDAPAAQQALRQAGALDAPRDTGAAADEPEELCPLVVQVQTADGVPASGAVLQVVVQRDGEGMFGLIDPSAPRQEVTADASGRVSLPDMVCATARLSPRGDQYIPATVAVDTLVEQQVILTLQRGTWVHGLISDPAGSPIPGATYAGRADEVRYPHTQADASGQYSLMVPGDTVLRLTLSHPGYLTGAASVDIPPGLAELEHTLTLQPGRPVVLQCPGLPDDSCVDLYPLLCRAVGGEAAARCLDEGSGDEVVCFCPMEGEVEVVGGVQSVILSPEEDVAILDYRSSATVRARIVTGEPLPEDCSLFFSTELGTLDGACDENGDVEVFGVPTGDRDSAVSLGGHIYPQPPVQLHRGLNELGTIQIGGLGSIKGNLIDARSGEGLVGISLMVMSPEGAFPAVTGTEGSFSVTGLQDGDYMILALGDLEPGQFHVSVEDGAESQVELVAEQRSDQEVSQGFDTHVNADSRYEVVDVQPGSPAEQAGLQLGDLILAVGKTSESGTEHIKEAGTSLPPVNLTAGGFLVVERDGEEVRVPD